MCQIEKEIPIWRTSPSSFVSLSPCLRAIRTISSQNLVLSLVVVVDVAVSWRRRCSETECADTHSAHMFIRHCSQSSRQTWDDVSFQPDSCRTSCPLFHNNITAWISWLSFFNHLLSYFSFKNYSLVAATKFNQWRVPSTTTDRTCVVCLLMRRVLLREFVKRTGAPFLTVFHVVNTLLTAFVCIVKVFLLTWITWSQRHGAKYCSIWSKGCNDKNTVDTIQQVSGIL